MNPAVYRLRLQGAAAMFCHAARQRFTLAVLVVALAAGSLILTVRRAGQARVVIREGPEGEGLAQSVEASGGPELPGESAGKLASVTVHVCGAVRKPGVYTLSEGARVADAVAAAGGLGEDACEDSINLAGLLVDSTQVYIPVRVDCEQGRAPSLASVGATPSDFAAQSMDTPGSPRAAGELGHARLNINTATAVELEDLPGIGPALAQRILESRRARGRFDAPEQLIDVPGIGPKKYAALGDLISVR